MVDTDSIRYKNVMANLGIAFGKAISSPLSTLYWNGLKDITIDLFETAAEQIIANDRAFPRVSRIRSLIKEIQGQRYAKQQLLADPDRRTDGEHECGVCRDTGWMPGICTPDNLCKWCRAGEPSHPATFVRRCPCYKTNSIIKARIAHAQETVFKPDRARSRDD